MANAVNSAQYQARIKQAEALFEGQNFTRRQTINLGGGYEIVKDAYRLALGAAAFKFNYCRAVKYAAKLSSERF